MFARYGCVLLACVQCLHNSAIWLVLQARFFSFCNANRGKGLWPMRVLLYWLVFNTCILHDVRVDLGRQLEEGGESTERKSSCPKHWSLEHSWSKNEQLLVEDNEHMCEMCPFDWGPLPFFVYQGRHWHCLHDKMDHPPVFTHSNNQKMDSGEEAWE